MLVKKDITSQNGKIVNTSQYKCDMCRKILTKQQRIVLSTTDIGGDPLKKRYDLCEKCMKTIEKNVSIWYDKFIKNK